MNDLTVTISDLATDETVGTGRLSRTIPGRTITNGELDVAQSVSGKAEGR